MALTSGSISNHQARYAALSNNTASWWFLDSGLRKHALAILVSYLGYLNIGFDGALISGLLANRIFLYDVGFTDPNKIGIMIAGSALGGLPSTFMVPYVADRFGRRITFVIGAVFTIVGGLLQTFLKGGWPMFGGRFVMGFGTSFAGVGSAMYVAEVAHPRLRPQATALYGTNYYIGSIIAAWTTYGSLKIANSWSWKLCTILQCVPGALQLMILPFVEESPRFLMARGKVAEAQRVLAKYHANGEEDDELVRFEMETIAMNVSEAAAHKTEGSYRDFLRTPGNRKRLFIVVLLGFSAQWVGNGIISYFLPAILETVGMTSPTSQTAFNGGLQISNWIITIIASLLAERIGRRKLFITSLTGMLASYIIITACSAKYASDGTLAAGNVVLAFLYIYFGFYDIGFTAMGALYLTEILPYELRARGSAIFLFCTTAAVFFNAYVNPVALAAIAWRYYFVYIAVNAIVLVIVIFTFPETKGLLLEDVAEIFDGRIEGKLDVEQGHDEQFGKEEVKTIENVAVVNELRG